MASPAFLSDPELLLQLPAMLTRERAASADVIEFLIEIERRDLFLEQACSSLYSFYMERLGYSEDEAIKRVRVTRLARRIPGVLDELRSGALACRKHVNQLTAEMRRVVTQIDAIRNAVADQSSIPGVVNLSKQSVVGFRGYLDRVDAAVACATQGVRLDACAGAKNPAERAAPATLATLGARGCAAPMLEIQW